MPGNKLILLVGMVLTIILLLIYGVKSGINPDNFQAAIKNYGALAPIVFILIYTIASVFFMPITPLSIAGGILFGPFFGTVYTVLGATFGATASFLVSRYLAKDYIDKKSPYQVMYVQGKIREQGWKFIALMRITPIFPFNFQNYIFGVTDISLKTFFWVSLISLTPGSFTYVYIGYIGVSAVRGGGDIFPKILLAVTLLFMITLLPYLIKKIKQQVTQG